MLQAQAAGEEPETAEGPSLDRFVGQLTGRVSLWQSVPHVQQCVGTFIPMSGKVKYFTIKALSAGICSRREQLSPRRQQPKDRVKQEKQ